MRNGRGLEAGQGLTLDFDADGSGRIAWGEADWFGPVGFRLELGGEHWTGAGAEPAAKATQPRLHSVEARDAIGAWSGFEIEWNALPVPLGTSVRAYADRPLIVFRLEARAAIDTLGTGSFDRPGVVWPWLRPDARSAGGVPAGTRGYGHQYTEFSFPTFSDDSLASFLQFPQRPSVIEPLWLIAPDGRCLMLAPLDGFHEQVIAVPRRPEHAADGVRCGWHGDLEAVRSGFATELGLFAADGPRTALDAWGRLVRERHGTRRPSRYADATVGRLSYWTDNGGAYWYRTEPGLDVTGTLTRVADELRRADVPVAAFELDSWFYPHEKTRPVNPEGQEHVPPTGLMAWDPREDILPDGVDGLRRAIGGAPLILHTRHMARRSPYFDTEPAWVDGDRAHPRDPAFFDRWFAQAASWGAITIEHDWLVEVFLGVRGLRAAPGRARAWQEALNAAAREHGLSLLWCMATPADFFQTVTLDRVVSIRTSGDYRYLAGNAAHWVRFLYTNALARALGLHPFKDVFLTHRGGEGWDGDPHAEAEALLAALSSGPVGIGDRAGRTDRSVVMRTCRADGVLVKPDVAIAALDRCFRRDAYFEPEPLIGETHSAHPAGRWHYLACFNAWREAKPLAFRVELADLGSLQPRSEVLAYDWRRGTATRLSPGDGLDLELGPGEWSLHWLCPLLPGGLTLFGDSGLYAGVGDRRVSQIRMEGGGLAFEVMGAPGEAVWIDGWAERPLVAVHTRDPGGDRALVRCEQPLDAPPDAARRVDTASWWQPAEGGRFRLALCVPARGWIGVSLR